MNGFTIYQYTKRDERDGHKIGEYCVYYSADVREFGTAYSTPEFEDLGTLAEALENIDGNYNGAAYSILSEQTTCVDFSDVEELAARLENGGKISEAERDAADAAGVIVPEDVDTVEDVTEESTEDGYKENKTGGRIVSDYANYIRKRITDAPKGEKKFYYMCRVVELKTLYERREMSTPDVMRELANIDLDVYHNMF